MKMLLIMNSGSRAGRGKRLWPIWESMLHSSDVDFSAQQTQSMQDAFDLAKNAIGYDCIVAVGGDGTINAVADGILQSHNPNIKMGVLYAGTSPDFCKFHHIPVEPNLAFQTLIMGHSVAIDVAKITFHDGAGHKKTAHFLCSCNIGLGSSIAKYANRWRGLLGDHIGTAFATVFSLFTTKPNNLNLKIDHQSIDFVNNNNLSIILNPYIASGLKLDVDKRADDGYFLVLGVNKKNKLSLLKLLPTYYSGTIVKDKQVLLKKAIVLSITSLSHQPIEFDGDPQGFLPAKIELLPRQLKLIRN